MKKVWWLMLFMFVLFTLIPRVSQAQLLEYGKELCGDTVNFYCLEIDETIVKTSAGTTIKEKKVIPTWEMLWPNETDREIVMKINRRNIALKKGDILAVPYDMLDKTFFDYSPFPYQIESGEKMIIWDPSLLAYGAYDQNGTLVRWGPGVGGKDKCSDIGRSCLTRPGEFHIIRKEGLNFRSGRYPLGCSGSKCAPMPYSMFFEDNYALHSGNLPGANASHGCVRLFYSDAAWLNQNFVEIGTKVIIKPYPKPRA
jgi:hypothetical protein